MVEPVVFARRAAGLEWLLFDVDGVLTDGGLYYSRRGEQLKRFHVRDGLAFRLAQRAGLKIGLLSGRGSRPLRVRARARHPRTPWVDERTARDRPCCPSALSR